MQEFRFYHIPFLSFFSKGLYRTAGLHWKGICFGYLLLLLTICWTLHFTNWHFACSKFVAAELPVIIEQIPVMTFKGGELSIEEEQPYYISIPDEDVKLLVIETTGKMNSIQDTDAYMLLTKNKLHVKPSDVKTEIHDLSEVPDYVINKEKVEGWIEFCRKYWAIAGMPLALIGSLISRMLQVLILGGIAMVFAALLNANISFDGGMRLSVVAMTPTIIISTALLMAGVHFSNSFLAYFALTVCFLFYGVKVCAEPEGQSGQEFSSPVQTV